jgi:hypothetical protein
MPTGAFESMAVRVTFSAEETELQNLKELEHRHGENEVRVHCTERGEVAWTLLSRFSSGSRSC